MVNGQLIDYIKQQSSQGIPQEQIIDYLLSVGWRETEINEALWEANSNVPVPTHLLKKENTGGNIFSMSIKSFFIVIFVFWFLWEAINIYDYKVNPNPKVSNYYSLSLKIYKSLVDYSHYENNTACPVNQSFADVSYPNCSCPLDLDKKQFYITQNKKTFPVSGQYICVNTLVPNKNTAQNFINNANTPSATITNSTTTIINQYINQK